MILLLPAIHTAIVRNVTVKGFGVLWPTRD